MGCISIEELQPNDLVYAHDGQPHPVLRVMRRRFVGKMVGILHAQTSQPLWLTEDHLVLSARRVKALSPHGGWSGIPQTHIDFARQMRRKPTPPEAKLWKRLRGNQTGVSFRRQHQIGPYIADFYSRQAALIVEVDGAGTHSTEDAKAYDAERDAYTKALGLRVMRFTAAEVISKTDSVVEAILHASRECVLPDDPQKQWRYACNLSIGDTVYIGVNRHPTSISNIVYEETAEEVYDLEVEGAHSFLTEVCAVHNCGSATSLYHVPGSRGYEC